MAAFSSSEGHGFGQDEPYDKGELDTNLAIRGRRGDADEPVHEQREPGEIDGRPFKLADLDNCVVVLLDHAETISIDNVHNSRIFIGACKGLVLVRNCSNCTFTLAARQFRSQDVRDCCFFLYCMTDPVIERSSNLEFGPFNGAYPEHADHVQAAGLDLASDKWWRVYDMTSSAAPTGPHFRLITMQEWGNHEGVEPWLPAGEGADPAVPLTWPPQAVWQVEWEDALRAKLEAEQAKERSEKERAQEELDQFYDRRTDLYAHRQARNRELEQLFLDKIESEENEENPFARVLSLIGAGSSSTAGDSGVGADKSRFRSLLFDLRERAPPSLERSALSASSSTTVGSSANATTGRSRGGGAGSLDADESSDGGRRAGGAAQGEEGER